MAGGVRSIRRTAVVWLAAVSLAVASGGAAETRTVSDRYEGFVLLEPPDCNNPEGGAVCFPVSLADSTADVVIDDDVAHTVMAVASVHYLDRPVERFERICDRATLRFVFEPDSQPAFLMITVYPHGFFACAITASPVPVAGTITVTMR